LQTDLSHDFQSLTLIMKDDELICAQGKPLFVRRRHLVAGLIRKIPSCATSYAQSGVHSAKLCLQTLSVSGRHAEIQEPVGTNHAEKLDGQEGIRYRASWRQRD